MDKIWTGPKKQWDPSDLKNNGFNCFICVPMVCYGFAWFSMVLPKLLNVFIEFLCFAHIIKRHVDVFYFRLMS